MGLPEGPGQVSGVTVKDQLHRLPLRLRRLVQQAAGVADPDLPPLHRLPQFRHGQAILGQHPGGVGHQAAAHAQCLGRLALGAIA